MTTQGPQLAEPWRNWVGRRAALRSQTSMPADCGAALGSSCQEAYTGPSPPSPSALTSRISHPITEGLRGPDPPAASLHGGHSLGLTPSWVARSQPHPHHGDKHSALPASQVSGSKKVSPVNVPQASEVTDNKAPGPMPVHSMQPPHLRPLPHQAGDLAGEQEGSSVFQQLLLVPNFLLARLREANPCRRRESRGLSQVEGGGQDSTCLTRSTSASG